MLHVTNGDSAIPVLRAGGLEGDVLPWRDVLHEGPVPGGLDDADLRRVRARFLATQGPASEAEVLADLEARDARLDAALAAGEPVVLWFEADLYDLLQLAQILARPFATGPRLVLVGRERFRFVAGLSRAEVASELVAAPVADPAPYAAAWDAFRDPDPRGLEPLAAAHEAEPPTATPTPLAAALRRHLEQFPDVTTGLARSEAALLRAVASGARTPEAAFLAAQVTEERPFLGDTTAFAHLARLQAPPAPLLDDALNLTEHGRAVLDGGADWAGPPTRELGGVTLSAGRPEWRWDPAAGRLRRTADA